MKMEMGCFYFLSHLLLQLCAGLFASHLVQFLLAAQKGLRWLFNTVCWNCQINIYNKLVLDISTIQQNLQYV